MTAETKTKAKAKGYNLETYWLGQLAHGKATICPLCASYTKSKTGFCKKCLQKR